MAPKTMAPKAAPKKEPAKRKAEEAEEEPSKKEAKKEEVEETSEKEKNAATDSRAVLKSAVSFNSVDTTLNVVPAMDGKVLMSLTEGGMQYLVAGARATVGVKAGRYMFEVKIIEALNPAESSQGVLGRVPQPRQLVKLGFSTAASSLILGDSDESVFFDSEGFFTSSRQKHKTSQPFTRDQALAVVLNLDSKSPNANTISLFRDGARISDPQPLPDSLKGKPLFPHICFRNVTVQVNMGPEPFKALPFKCRTVQGAAAADVLETTVPKDAKYEIVLPVCLPDEGTFDWLDSYLEKNPKFIELSDRKVQDWALSSGLPKPKPGLTASNDKPTFAYGLTGMDDSSIPKVVKSITTTVQRNYVVMEVKSNLIADERKAILKRYSAPCYKKVAHVVIGTPKPDFKKVVLAKLLEAKQEKADAEWHVKKAEQDRLKQTKKRQKEMAKLQKEAEAKRQKLMQEFKKRQEEEAKKKAEEEAKKKAEAGEAEAMEVETKEEDAKQEVKEEEMKVEQTETKEEPKEEEEEEEEVDELGEEPPKVELTDEEKNVLFRPKIGHGDLAPAIMSKFFADFSLPEKAEGFDEIIFEWANASQSKEHLRKWILETKQNSKIEDLQPSQYFKDKLAAWQKQYTEWQGKQAKFKISPPKKEPEPKDGDNEEKEKKMALDIFSVEDVSDIGNGEPLFAHFGPEDWTLLQMRYELHLLQDAFKKDVNDPDREKIPEPHLTFYYSRYFGKALNPKTFGFSTNAELLDLVKDTVTLSGEPVFFSSQLSEEVDTADIFVKFTEDGRRERKRRSDAGDESAKLKFTPPLTPAVAATRPPLAAGIPATQVAAARPPLAATFGKGPIPAYGKGAAWGKGRW